MNAEHVLERLAPCGLHCGKCFAYREGDIRKNSLALKEALGNFDIYAERFIDLLDAPEFKEYPAFRNMLTYFSRAACAGCRKEQCKLFKDCRVRDCAKDKKVDFCFQCEEFPCGDTGFDPHLEDRSVKINMRMKETGIEKYYEEIKDKARYV